ncbi:LysR family transcriptional regulator [Halobacillus shinanisalinarum]|uniref:LysR family transcriptional regulator n=1 Tax=Halobacillus shinanisalinarum TaxID=2932258 RepID=A0ABY4GU35_9BACI|nr:LysR family transcriptional regulator [Halobacillus shinanisalinarum]UOQ91675.1 LysR family transcriptional regulator [Halobacillus shinanisalinarum]
MKIEDYRLLLQLSNYKTIRSTAKKVLISQPAITQRLKYIEDYIGVKIFVRTPKQLILTPGGEQVIKHAKKMLLQEKQLHNELMESKGEVGGTLSLGVSSLVSQHNLPVILEEYTKAYPKVTIDLITGVSEEIRQSAADFHVCIVRGEPLPDYTCIHLFSDPLYLFDTKKIADDVVRPFIEFKTDAEYQKLVEGWMINQTELRIRRTIKVDQFETAKQLMKIGLGITVLPKSIATDDLLELPHIPLEREGKPIARETWVCLKEGIRSLPQVEAFVSMLANKTWV